MVLGFSREEMEERVQDVIDFADIGDHLYQPVKTYSSGMFVRLAFAVAINVDPDILIVDEALAVGDLEFQLKCMEKFTEIKNSGKTILFVSHDVNSIRRFCDRTFWLQHGKVVEYGDTMDVTTNYENFLKKKSIKTVDREATMKDETPTPDIIEVDHAELLNADYEPLEMVTQDEKVIVKIEYTVKNDQIKKPVCGVAIRTVDNHYVCGLNTLLDGVQIPWKKGRNVFYLEYEKMSLLTGEYYFDIETDESTSVGKIVAQIKENSDVLEFGPGNGRMTSYLMEEKKCQVSIVELDKELYDHVSQFSTDAFYGNIDENDWVEYFAGKTFDYIVFADVLEHLMNPQSALAKVKPFLKPGGQILITFPNLAHNSVLIDLFNNRLTWNETGLLDATHKSFYLQEGFEKVFA